MRHNSPSVLHQIVRYLLVTHNLARCAYGSDVCSGEPGGEIEQRYTESFAAAQEALVAGWDVARANVAKCRTGCTVARMRSVFTIFTVGDDESVITTVLCFAFLPNKRQHEAETPFATAALFFIFRSSSGALLLHSCERHCRHSISCSTFFLFDWREKSDWFRHDARS
jgi:hypothetical protein